MHQQAKVIFLFMFLWLVSKAQGQNGKRAENTILKLDNDQNPYSDSQNRWMKKNGFQVNQYHWRNEDLNTQIKTCLKKRDEARLFGLFAGMTAAISGVKFISNDEGAGGYLFLSATTGLISLGKFNKSKRQLEQIEK